MHWSCLTCAPGFVMQPQGSKLCLSTCPTGYTTIAGVCQGSNQVIFNIQLDTITPTVKSVGGIEALNGQTAAYFPPTFEVSDPRPSQHRGYYFSQAYMQLPPGGGQGTPLILPLTFTIWLRPQGAGTLFHKLDVFSVALNSNPSLVFSGGSPSVTYIHPSVLSIDTWAYLGLTISFSSATGLSCV